MLIINVVILLPLAVGAPSKAYLAGCPAGFTRYGSGYGLGCQGGGTCWRPKSAGFQPGGEDGTRFGWPGYWVQCESGSPQLTANSVGPCPAGFTRYASDYGLGCQGGGTCWRHTSSGHMPGGTDGTRFGWPGYLVQCELGYPQLSANTPGPAARCPAGYDHYTSDYGLGCKGGGTCWRYKASGHLPGGEDGSRFGWPGYLVQCESGYPQLTANSVGRCPVGFDHYASDYGLGCQGGGTCWRSKSSGPLPGGADGTRFGWPGYLVQCERGYPKLAASSVGPAPPSPPSDQVTSNRCAACSWLMPRPVSRTRTSTLPSLTLAAPHRIDGWDARGAQALLELGDGRLLHSFTTDRRRACASARPGRRRGCGRSSPACAGGPPARWSGRSCPCP